MKSALKKILENTLSNNNENCLKDLLSLKISSLENYFIIDNIYLKLYNKDPQWKIKEYDSFLEKLKQTFIESNVEISDELSEKNADLLYAMANCVYYSKANEKILSNDKIFGEKINQVFKV